jgi:hypothetical protein
MLLLNSNFSALPQEIILWLLILMRQPQRLASVIFLWCLERLINASRELSRFVVLLLLFALMVSISSLANVLLAFHRICHRTLPANGVLRNAMNAQVKPVPIARIFSSSMIRAHALLAHLTVLLASGYQHFAMTQLTALAHPALNVPITHLFQLLVVKLTLSARIVRPWMHCVSNVILKAARSVSQAPV